MKLNLNALRFAAYSVVGYGTEVQSRPIYEPRWAGTAGSGWSFGVTQTDLGVSARSVERNQLTTAYAAWQKAEAAAGQIHPQVSSGDLSTKNNGGLTSTQRSSLTQFLATPNGRAIVDGWDAANVTDLTTNRASALDTTTYFGSMDAKDQFVVVAGAMKVANQSGGATTIERLLNGQAVSINGQTFQILPTDTSLDIRQKVFSLTQAYKDPLLVRDSAKAQRKAEELFDIYSSPAFALRAPEAALTALVQVRTFKHS
jgi:hypothetical protein